MDPMLLLALYVLYAAVLLTLAWRITLALEGIARHLLEIARDIKKSSHFIGDKQE
jgi:hypothetical protein